VVDFTGVAIDDYSVAIIAGFNWLNHCAVLAGVDPDKFWRPLRNFRQIFWSLTDGGHSMAPVPAAIGCWSSGSIRR
jgi:hypothetical protein